MSDTVRTGGCQCGAVRYSAKGPPLVIAHCHCESCQRGSGAGHSTGAMYGVENVTLSGTVSEYRRSSLKGNDVTRVFCPICGSPIYGRNTGMEGFMTLTLGTFDDASDLEPEVTVFGENRMPWDAMDDDLPTFPTQPDWKPEG